MSSFTSSQSFVQRTFPPLIGSLTSPSVEQICQKNNVSFAELLRPFCNVYVDHQLKDPSGTDLCIKHLKVGVQDVKELPPETLVAQKLLKEAVAGAWCDVTREIRTTSSNYNLVVDIPAECPWFHAWTETFFQVQFPSEHEFIRHLLGCILVTSTADPPETLTGLLDNLKQMQAPSRPSLPKWFCPAIFKYYILIHEARSGDQATALASFETIKTVYGADNCFFLELNSRQQGESGVINHWTECRPRPVSLQKASATDQQQNHNSEPLGHPLHEHPLSPHLDNHFTISSVTNDSLGKTAADTARGECGGCLSSKDVDSLRDLMGCLIRKALLPHVERQIFILNDLVANKKGMSRSLLSATKRLFGSPRPGGSGGTPGQAATSAVFATDAPELQLRRLGDLYFIFASYSNAFQSYYAAKRELGLEQAWLYYAGALEMAALSAFMLPEPTKKAVEYMEEAIMTYLNSCRLPQFATRATLLSFECLKERSMFAEATKQLIRMTSEDSDLRSALLLEQAAYCVLKDSKPRKYAFNMVLAGYRFSKAGQRRHALRCVRQALQVYSGRGWGLAEDHIHSTIGRLTGQLHQQGGPGADQQLLVEGLRSLSQLLHSRSRLGAPQQAVYLLEYLNMYQTWERVEGNSKLSHLSLPLVEDNSACVRIVAGGYQDTAKPDTFHADSPEESTLWARMEEVALAETVGVAMVFRPSLPVLTKASLNSQGPVMAVNERLVVQVALRNPLQISLPLARLRLLWTWTGHDGLVVEGGNEQTLKEEEEAVASTEELPSLLLPPQAVNFVSLSVMPRRSGSLLISGLAYSLTTAVASTGVEQIAPVVRGRQDLVVRGPKLRPPKDRPFSDFYADDKRLMASVVEASPLLIVTGVPPNMDMLCGQMEEVHLELVNAGNLALTYLYVSSDAAGLLALPPKLTAAVKPVQDADSNLQFQVVTVDLNLVGGSLHPGAKLPLSLWVRAPDTPGPKYLHLLLLYGEGASGCGTRHRVVRATLRLMVSDGLQVSAIAMRSPRGGRESANLCISASNQQSAPATLCRLVLASRHWVLEGPALCPKDLTVKSLESLFLASKAHRRQDDLDECCTSTVELNGPTSILGTAATYLLLRRAICQLMVLGIVWEATVEGRHIKCLSIAGIGTIGSPTMGLPTPVPDLADVSHATHTFAIFGPDREEATRAAPDAAEASLVCLSLTHLDKVSHSFSDNRICLVDVSVCVSNSSSQEITLELNPASVEGAAPRPSLLRSHIYKPQAAAAFTWAGRARTKLVVPPRGRVTTVLRAAVAKPGTYDLAVRLAAAISDSKGMRPLPPPPESPLVVADADASAQNAS